MTKDSWVLLGPKDSQAYPALPAAPWWGPKGTEDLRDNLACQGSRDPWGLQGFLGLMG